MKLRIGIIGTVVSKGRPQKWLPKFMQRWFTWTKRYEINEPNVAEFTLVKDREIKLVDLGPVEFWAKTSRNPESPGWIATIEARYQGNVLEKITQTIREGSIFDWRMRADKFGQSVDVTLSASLTE